MTHSDIFGHSNGFRTPDQTLRIFALSHSVCIAQNTPKLNAICLNIFEYKDGKGMQQSVVEIGPD